MFNTILVGPASLCVSIFKVGLRELSALDKLLQIFSKTHGLDLGLTSAPVEDLLLLAQGVEAAAAELEAAEQLTTWAAAHQSLCCLLSNSCCLRESHGERRGNIEVLFRVCPSVKVIRFQLFSTEELFLLILCSWSQEAFLIPIHLDLIPTTKWGPDRHPPNSIRSHRTIFH